MTNARNPIISSRLRFISSSSITRPVGSQRRRLAVVGPGPDRVLQGTGVNAKSRITNFHGLVRFWRDYRNEEVASPEAWNCFPD
jgi:hypothetical protein